MSHRGGKSLDVTIGYQLSNAAEVAGNMVGVDRDVVSHHAGATLDATSGYQMHRAVDADDAAGNIAEDDSDAILRRVAGEAAGQNCRG